MDIYLKWVRKTNVQGVVTENALPAGGAKGTSCCWIFKYRGGYRPGALQRDRFLIAIEFTKVGQGMLEQDHFDFENPRFSGESGHPQKIIVKNNEPGARGIGRYLLEDLNGEVSKIREATRAEFAWAISESVTSSREKYQKSMREMKRMLR